MTPDGMLHPCSDKSQLVHKLESLSSTCGDAEESNPDNGTANYDNTCIVCDGMAVVNEQVVFKGAISNCDSYVVFDNYDVASSLKETTRNQRTKGKCNQFRDYKVEDKTCIKDFGVFLSSTGTKDLLTLYLADKLTRTSSSPVTAITRIGMIGVTSNMPSVMVL